MNIPNIILGNDLFETSKKSADQLIDIGKLSIKENDAFRIALSGGKTPKALYQLLVSDKYKGKLDWSKVHFFFSDERCVGPMDPESNYKMAFEALLSKLLISSKNIHRIKGKTGEQGAIDYEQEIISHFDPEVNQTPEFDLILLGMGNDGHTASIFPESPVLEENKRLVVWTKVLQLGKNRITFTPQLINHAKNIMFIVTGENKAQMLNKALQGEFKPNQYPSQLTRLSKGCVYWFVDRGAGQFLP